ncbi:MAG: ricin-type beta-trefoil lectin domain protein [Roseiarcus sp.]
MWLSETKLPQNWRASAVLLAALSAGGCFQPLYGEAAHPGLTADMRAIAVDPIKDRIGHYLGNDLILDLNGTGAAPPPKYRLAVTTTIESETPTVSSQIQVANAATVTGIAKYTLTPTGGGDAVVTGEATAVAVYDRTEERFANLRAERDAEIKLAKSLADEIELRLAARLTARMGEIRGMDNRCVDIPNGATEEGAKLNYYDCDATDEQEWTLRDGAIIGKDGKCIGIPNGDAPDGAVLEIRTCVAGAAEQKWSVENGAIVGKGGKCMDLPDGNTENGTPIEARKCNGSPEQQWNF